MQDVSKRGTRTAGANVQVSRSGDNSRVGDNTTADVRRVVGQVVEASCNSFARFMADRCRQMMCDESPARVPSGGNAWYIAGRNDVLRELAKWLDARVEQSLVEATTRDATALVEVDARRCGVPGCPGVDGDGCVHTSARDEEMAIGCAYPCAECGRCCCANVVARSTGRGRR